jgi:hypothetical protein
MVLETRLLRFDNSIVVIGGSEDLMIVEKVKTGQVQDLFNLCTKYIEHPMSEFRTYVVLVESYRLRPADLDHISSPFLAGIVVMLHRRSLLVLPSCLLVPAR